jgi:hypothetical protein
VQNGQEALVLLLCKKELAGGGGKWRAEHRGPISSLTRARAVVWWLGNGNEAAAMALTLWERQKREGVGAVRTGGGVSLL